MYEITVKDTASGGITMYLTNKYIFALEASRREFDGLYGGKFTPDELESIDEAISGAIAEIELKTKPPKLTPEQVIELTWEKSGKTPDDLAAWLNGMLALNAAGGGGRSPHEP